VQLYVSYLEVYNETGYDLLDSNYEEAHRASSSGTGGPSLPRVSMLEDEDGNCHLKNLSMHLVRIHRPIGVTDAQDHTPTYRLAIP
jgi:kinesin family protein 6/9